MKILGLKKNLSGFKYFETYNNGGSLYINRDGVTDLLEKDFSYSELYKEEGRRYSPHHSDKMIVDVCDDCNLNCSVCFNDKFSARSRSYEEIVAKLSGVSGKIISISGGEPTLNKDIFRIIRFVSERNTPVLVSNCIKLNEEDFLKKLKDSGLHFVNFSMNTLKEKVSEKIHRKDLLKEKYGAIKLLKKHRMKAILSTVVERGINENCLGELLNFALLNRDLFIEMRIRSALNFKVEYSPNRLGISEIVSLISKQAGFSEKGATREILFKNQVNKNFNHDFFISKPCAASFHLVRKKERWQPLFENYKKAEEPGNFGMVKTALSLYGFSFLKGVISREIRSNKIVPSSEFFGERFKVSVRCWPDLLRFNLFDIQGCTTSQFYEDYTIPFCLGNLINNYKINKTLFSPFFYRA